MTTYEADQFLANNVGKKLQINGQEAILSDYERMPGNKFKLNTSDGIIEASLNEVSAIAIINERHKNHLPAVNTPELKVVSTVTMGDVKNALIDSLKKVQLSAEYIPQAQAVAGISKTIIELAKVELQTLQHFNK